MRWSYDLKLQVAQQFFQVLRKYTQFKLKKKHKVTPPPAVRANRSDAHTFPMFHIFLEENKSDTGHNKCFFLGMKAHLFPSQEELSRHFLETSNSSGRLVLARRRRTINCTRGIYTTCQTAGPPNAIFFLSVQRIIPNLKFWRFFCEVKWKHQLDATLCRFYFCRVTLHVSGASARNM